MKSKVSTAILLLCSFVSLGQTTSRMATNQAKPRLESPPNIVAVDRSDTLVNRMWVVTAGGGTTAYSNGQEVY